MCVGCGDGCECGVDGLGCSIWVLFAGVLVGVSAGLCVSMYWAMR